MDFLALGGCHQPIHPVPRKPSVSSKHSSKLRFLRFLFFTPARAPVFCFGMLALLLTLSCTYHVGAVTFAFNGFQESDVYIVPNSPWTFQSNTNCFYFDPPEASWNESVPGRFLYPDLVQMKDPVTKKVKSFSTTFIYHIQANGSTFGPGMSFIVVPDNVTVGAALDYMGLLTTDTSTSIKNYESNNHTLGVELDTFKNPEFNDPNGNHIGVNLASMNSTFVVDPTYPLNSVVKNVYTQIWIDYFEADYRVDISIALYRESKPTIPQGSQTGVDLSLLLENMYIGFSTARGIESDNVPYVYAWSFSNDGIPAPPIVMGLNATSALPPADGPPAARSEVPSSQLLVSISPDRSLPPISLTNPPSPNTEAPGPTPTAKKNKSLLWRGILLLSLAIVAFSYGIWFLSSLHQRIVSQHPLHIFISHSNGCGKDFQISLNERMTSLLKSRVKIFFDRDNIEYSKVFAELARFDVGIVVISKEYFERKSCMIELIAFVEAQCNDPRNRICIIPLFYELTPKELKAHMHHQTWEVNWERMARGNHPIQVEDCRRAVNQLCTLRGIVYNSNQHLDQRDNENFYIDTICKEIDKFLWKERSFASILQWTKTTTIGNTFTRIYIGTEKKRRHANQTAREENDLMTYINKRLQFLFILTGLLNLFLSIILDNFFNELPISFIAFAILVPLTISLGSLTSGLFPQIPLRFIAFIKQRGFLQHVVPCSPWHDNVVIDYCGEVCPLEPLEGGRRASNLELPVSIQNFIGGDQISPQGTTAIVTTHSTFDSETQDIHVVASMQEGQDLEEPTIGSEMFEIVPLSRILERSYPKMATSQESSPNLQETSSRVGDIVSNIDRSSLFHILENERVSILEFNGPEINGFPLKVQAFKNTLTIAHAFDLSCTFKSKKTKKMYLTAERLQNLVENMCQWVENPYPIVVDESSNILHCMDIEDILWEFTKMVYSFRPVHVEHRFLAGFGKIKFIFVISYVFVSFMLSIIPLTFDRKSLFFLFFLLVLVPYLFVLCDTSPLTFYFIKSLFCPICIKIFGFNRLYKSRSSFRWCNEFRKKKIVNPSYFWIDQEYANTFPERASCFDVRGFLEFSSPPKDQSFTMSCQGWLIRVPSPPPNIIRKKQHEYILQVKFDAVELMRDMKDVKDVKCYTKVKLAFFENDHLLGDFNYSAIEVQKLDFIEQLFHCFSDPSFGGYVEKIYPTGYFSTTFVAHYPRFIDICHKICSINPIPELLVATRKPGSKFIVGVPLWSSEL